MLGATFTRSDPTAFACLDDFGLEVTGQLVEPDRAVLAAVRASQQVAVVGTTDRQRRAQQHGVG